MVASTILRHRSSARLDIRALAKPDIETFRRLRNQHAETIHSLPSSRSRMGKLRRGGLAVGNIKEQLPVARFETEVIAGMTKAGCVDHDRRFARIVRKLIN